MAAPKNATPAQIINRLRKAEVQLDLTGIGDDCTPDGLVLDDGNLTGLEKSLQGSVEQKGIGLDECAVSCDHPSFG